MGREMDIRFSWLDVFTDRPLAGNPLAVVPDADGLETDQMQALARELGLSETVFVTGGAEALRIFTRVIELPLAGHPVVGAALELARLGRVPAEGRAVFRTGAGEVPVDLSGGVATMTQPEPRLGGELDATEVAGLLGLAASDLVGTPAICATAWPIAFARTRDRETLRRVDPDLRALTGWPRAEGIATWSEEDGGVAMRFFGLRIGVSEDPATGAAAGALGALRVFRGGEPGAFSIEQGAEVGRPSTIQVEVGGEPGRPSGVRVGGRAVLVLEGSVRADALGC
jgi:trans-2,3-dihydro-3-hydroxyanthranilate isomerase